MAFVPELFETTWKRKHPKGFEVEQRVRTYLARKPARPQDSQYQEAYQRTLRDFTLPSPVRPLHINDSIKQFQNVDRSPGLPYTSEGLKRKDEVDPQRIKQYAHNLKYGYYQRCDTPCTAAVKTMVTQRGDKWRLVWVYPAHMTFIEGMFAQPLIRRYQAQRGAYGLWIQYSKGDLRYLRSKRNTKAKWLGVDWSGFDASVPAWLIRDAFKILRAQVDFTRYEEWGIPTDAYTLPRLWNRIVQYFINTPMRLQSGKVIRTERGVPSGSYFTNMIGSIVNAIVWNYLLPSQSTNRWYVGDDALLEVAKDVVIEDLAAQAMQVFGMTLNPHKTSLGINVSFLGYEMGPTGYPLARFDKLVAQLMIPAYSDRTLEDFCSRARALQLSCFGHGCWEFVLQVQVFLDDHAPDFTPVLHARDDLLVKLKALDLAHWPPLQKVMLLV